MIFVFFLIMFIALFTSLFFIDHNNVPLSNTVAILFAVSILGLFGSVGYYAHEIITIYYRESK